MPNEGQPAHLVSGESSVGVSGVMAGRVTSEGLTGERFTNK